MVFLGIGYDADLDQLREIFSEFGTVVDIHPMQGKDICFLHMDEKSGLSQTDVQNSVSTFFQLSMQWSVQPENHLDLTRSKLNMDHFQRNRFMTNIREKYDTLRISQNRNLCLI